MKRKGFLKTRFYSLPVSTYKVSIKNDSKERTQKKLRNKPIKKSASEKVIKMM